MGSRSGAKGRWKAAEEWLGQLFGVHRRPLSGNIQPGRDDQPGDDCLHLVLFLEAKNAEQYRAVRTLWDTCRKRAKGRPIVIGLRSKGRPGGMICFHSDDIRQVMQEYQSAEWFKARVRDRHPGETCEP
jgi:hypothetical protein